MQKKEKTKPENLKTSQQQQHRQTKQSRNKQIMISGFEFTLMEGNAVVEMLKRHKGA